MEFFGEFLSPDHNFMLKADYYNIIIFPDLGCTKHLAEIEDLEIFSFLTLPYLSHMPTHQQTDDNNIGSQLTGLSSALLGPVITTV